MKNTYLIQGEHAWVCPYSWNQVSRWLGDSVTFCIWPQSAFTALTFMASQQFSANRAEDVLTLSTTKAFTKEVDNVGLNTRRGERHMPVLVSKDTGAWWVLCLIFFLCMDMAQAVLGFSNNPGFKPAVCPDQLVHPPLHPSLPTFSINCYIQISATGSQGWGTRLHPLWIKWAKETYLLYGVNTLLLLSSRQYFY